MSRRRIQEGALLVLLAVLAAVGVSVLGSGTPLRIVAGVALLLALPWLAASRLPPIRAADVDGGRVSGAGALSIALVILLGLLLSTSDAGITTARVAIGMLIVTAALAVIGIPATDHLQTRRISARTVFGAVLTVLAVAVAVFAFILARDRALTQAHGEGNYAAFLLPNGGTMDVGLTNATGRAARFVVREVDSGREAVVRVPARSSREVKAFVARPPSLRPEQRLTPKDVPPAKIRVVVKRGSRQVGPVLNLSTYAP